MTRTWSAVLARLGTPTGDGRILTEDGITSRDLPLPLSWQRVSDDGHRQSITVGRIEQITFGNGMVTARGSMLSEFPEYYQVIEQIEAGVTGPSVDLDDIEYVMDDQERIVITMGRIAGATLVHIPAFAETSIALDPLPAEPMVPEYYDMPYEAYAAGLAAFASTTSIPSAAPLPPAEWFDYPAPMGLGLTPLTVTEDGRVFGHIAPWDACHVGLPGCVTAPASPSGYAYFTVGEQRTQEGSVVPVGTLVTGPRHADAQLAYQAAQAHYDDVGAAVARVTAGEDEHGIWVAGWMLPGADAQRVEQFMSSPVSGDWRRIGGQLEMIAVCSVNAPGFPVPRARVAFSAGRQTALVGSFGVQAVRGELTAPAAAPEVMEVMESAHAAWARARWETVS